MDTQKKYQLLRNIALGEKMALFGVADVRDMKDQFLLPKEVSDLFSSAVSIGFRLSRAALRTVENAPSPIYFFHYQRVNILLDQTALKISSAIQDEGFNALPIPASQVIDWEKRLGSVSHREIARRAGLGWYGRNNLLVNPLYGSQVRYATVLTDMPLEYNKPMEENCGSCKACVSTCPAQAIGENSFDADACHKKLKEFVKIQGIGQMICGVCLKVCPGKNSRG